MNAIFPAGLVLACLLSVLSPDEALAASAEQSTVSTAATTVEPVNQAHAAKKPAPQKERPPIASKSRAASEVVRTTELPSTNVDLSLPSDMVRQLQPIGSLPLVRRAPLLPPLFGEKPKEESKFQLNGRLITNELQLQMRNEDRREVEGAALEFQFNQ
ncbi:translation initiation factor 2 [Pseudomonas sp. Irchel s3h17]|uniref:translation initiation factor 2 n=1 Tax=Pseudomonas sp. Irchel s3h17 TaxID=2009182 RepID=UPI000BA2F605|nr:translation initiation factor 2 [Pseudomonas sp. Irchel s3h17]